MATKSYYGKRKRSKYSGVSTHEELKSHDLTLDFAYEGGAGTGLTVLGKAQTGAVDAENLAPLNWNGLTGIQKSMVGIPAGNGLRERIGTRVNVKSIDFMIRLSGPAKEGTTNIETSQQKVYLLLVVDKQGNGSSPVLGDILQDPDAATEGPIGPTITGGQSPNMWFRALRNTSRFIVLMRKCIVCPNKQVNWKQVSSTTGVWNYAGWEKCEYSKHIECDLQINYRDSNNEADGTYSIAGVSCNNIVFFAWTSETNTSDNAAKTNGHVACRLRFKG